MKYANMANLTHLRGSCLPPFFQESRFPNEGYVLGRYCAPIPGTTDDVSCCLPCPATDWIYPDNFYSLTRIAGWINVGSCAMSTTLLLSFIFLPKAITKRQYLNVCMIIGIMLMEIGFIVPLGTRPAQCINEITPNDNHSSMACAWSGGLIVGGGVAVTMWILIRTLSMHLQICWDITPGTKFFYGAQIFGWGASAGIVASALIISGVSFRFGDACHINHLNSLKSLWGPLMGVAGISCILQVATFVYCMNVYLRNLRYDHKPDPEINRGQGGSGSPRVIRTRAVYRRVTKVVSLHSRGLLICAIMVADVAFFAVVFVYLDTKTQQTLGNFTELLPWLACLISNGGGHASKNKCLSIASTKVTPEAIVIATLVLMSAIGVMAWLLVGRWEMAHGWVDLLRKLRRKHDPAIGAVPPSMTEKLNYELLKVATPATTTVSPAMSIKSPESAYSSPLTRSESKEYFSTDLPKAVDTKAADARPYSSPRMSFSSPRRTVQPGWTLNADVARIGLGVEMNRGGDTLRIGWL